MMASTTEPHEGEKSDIDLIWMQVQERVVNLAGGDRGRLQSHLDIDGVLAFIDRAQASQKKKSEKYSWFRTAVSRTLQCIQTVGGVVSSAASQVSDISFESSSPHAYTRRLSVRQKCVSMPSLLSFKPGRVMKVCLKTSANY